MKKHRNETIISLLEKGGIGILPTDTLYGLVARAMDARAVERVYTVRGRDIGKPCIVLLSDSTELSKFGVRTTDWEEKFFRQHWPGAVSVVLPCGEPSYEYLHRGTQTIAFRVPEPLWLRALLRRTGPLVAPSANPQGAPPADTIAQAKRYFGGRVDFYHNGGTLASEPSTIVALFENHITILREGKQKILRT